jgi:hypothetical protein
MVILKHRFLNRPRQRYLNCQQDGKPLQYVYIYCWESIAHRHPLQVNNKEYERLGILGRGGSSKVYSVLCPTKRTVMALKRVALERCDQETITNYMNEVALLNRLRGHDRIIQWFRQTENPSNGKSTLADRVPDEQSVDVPSPFIVDGMWRNRLFQFVG